MEKCADNEGWTKDQIHFKVFFQSSVTPLACPSLEEKNEEMAWSEEVEGEEETRKALKNLINILAKLEGQGIFGKISQLEEINSAEVSEAKQR